MTGYFEWQEAVEAGKTVKNPSYVHGPDDELLLAAGLLAFHREGEDTEWRTTFTIITRTGEDAAGEVHDRMPVMITAADINAWADPTAGKDEAQELLRTLVDGFDPNRVERYRVDRAVGNVRNQSADLMAPVDEMRVP